MATKHFVIPLLLGLDHEHLHLGIAFDVSAMTSFEDVLENGYKKVHRMSHFVQIVETNIAMFVYSDLGYAQNAGCRGWYIDFFETLRQWYSFLLISIIFFIRVLKVEAFI